MSFRLGELRNDALKLRANDAVKGGTALSARHRTVTAAGGCDSPVSEAARCADMTLCPAARFTVRVGSPVLVQSWQLEPLVVFSQVARKLKDQSRNDYRAHCAYHPEEPIHVVGKLVVWQETATAWLSWRVQTV